jgi:hypothetical protein
MAFENLQQKNEWTPERRRKLQEAILNALIPEVKQKKRKSAERAK